MSVHTISTKYRGPIGWDGRRIRPIPINTIIVNIAIDCTVVGCRCGILTHTRRQLLRCPRAVRLAEALQLADQLVTVGAVVGHAAAERVAFARMPAVPRIRRLATGARCRNESDVVFASDRMSRHQLFTHVHTGHPVRTSSPGRRWPNTWRAESRPSRIRCGSDTVRCCPDRRWPAPE